MSWLQTDSTHIVLLLTSYTIFEKGMYDLQKTYYFQIIKLN